MSVKKIKLAGFAILLAVFIFSPTIASAGLADTLLSDFVVGVFQFIAFIFSYIGGILFSLAGFLVNIMLNLNLEILDAGKNPLVHVGWRIVRDLANLGFVLVIIVIAFATILRFEQYGVTKLLPKLIAAAIIVNFSFAIAAAFINFTHVLTNFFADRALGEGGRDLSTAISNAFGPQRFFIEDETALGPRAPDEEVGGLTGFGTAVLTSITGLIFTIVFTLIAAFVLLAFAFMLFMRYLYLTFLVILAPLTWLFWVMPALKGQFDKWWNKFFQWTFFAPAVMFFVYLALVSTRQLGEVRQEFAGNFFGGALASTMIHGAQVVVLSGILIGGLIIAQKMGIIGAAGAMGMATKAGKAGRAWAGRYALRAGTALPRSGVGRRVTEGLQKAGTGFGTGVFGRAGRFATAPLRQLGKGISAVGVVQGENLIKDAEKRQGSLSDDQLALRVATMNNFDRVAALTRLAKSKKLNKVPNVARYISDPATQAAFESYGKKDDYVNLEKTFGANNAMLTAKTDDERDEAAINFYATFSKSELAKVQYDGVFQSEPMPGLSDAEHVSTQKAVAHGIAKNNPGDIRKVFANVKSANIKNVIRAVEEVQKADADLAEDLEEVMKNTLDKRRMGELFEFEPLGTTPPATPTP